MKRFLKHLAVASAVTLALAGAAGAESRALRTALALWLGGNDEASLPEMARLARRGDVEAQVLLGRIEATDRGPSLFRLGLSRAAFNEIFRRPVLGSSFGRSWLRVAADDGNALAQALHASRFPVPDVGLIRRLQELGEFEASAHPIRIVALYGSATQKAELQAQGLVTDELMPFVTYTSGLGEARGDGLAALRHIAPQAAAAGDSDALAIAGVLALGYGFGDASRDNAWHNAVVDWVMSAPATRPIADQCRMACGNEAGACGFALFALTGGYYEVVRLDSPLETLIPQDRFLASPRARIMALRRAALTRSETGRVLASRDEVAEMSACAADLVAAERWGGP